ncbi:hypothetical protein Gpo141_00014543, partial [Globisporangium polare]
ANGHLEVIKFLHENRGDDCTTTAMDEAATNGHIEVVEYLNRNRTEDCRVGALSECRKRKRDKI